jgi:hypothetical protein
MIDLITENENKLELYWQHYKNCLEITHTGECDDQEFIELGKAANQWRLQKELVEKLKKELL